MRWQCEYFNSTGMQCPEAADRRIHFNNKHPFDHMDLCELHLEAYPEFKWSQLFREGELDPDAIYTSKG